MTSGKGRWLQRELPALVAGGVLDQAAADRLRQHFEADAGAGTGRKVAVVVFGGLGALLIGGGLLLLLAHNWDDLTRTMRASLTVGVLLAAQALAGWALLARRGSAAWGEGTAAFLSVAVGTSIALVSQTYHIPGDFPTFLLAWCLLALPLAFLFDSHGTAAIVWLLALLRACQVAWSQPGDAWFWLLAAAGGLHFVLAARRSERDRRLPLLAGVASAALVLGGLPFVDVGPVTRVLYLGGLLGFLYAAGTPGTGREATGWMTTLRVVAVAAIANLALVATYEFPWEGATWPPRFMHVPGMLPDVLLPIGLGVAVGMALGTIGLVRALRLLRESRWDEALPAGALVPALLGASAALAGHPVAAQALFNVYLAALGLTTLARGLGEARLGVTNLGLILLAALGLARFFDADLSFVARGVGFILVGLLFLGVNVHLVRKREEATP
jgi:uncharacterized membrane protein